MAATRGGLHRLTLVAMVVLALMLALAPSVALACHGQIYGYKFHDLNGNGTRDPGEPTLSGWTIKYKRVGSSYYQTYTDVTDGSGNYQFSNVPLDENQVRTFRVWEQLQNGWYASTPNSVDISLKGEGDSEQVNFGNLMPGAIQINKTWFQGDEEVDPPASPATICVRRTGPGTPAQDLTPQDAAGNNLAPSEINGQTYHCQHVTTTAAFTNLWPGTYEVVETSAPAGWTVAAPMSVVVESGNVGVGSTTIVVGSGNSYYFEFLGREGNTWTYRVKELSGKDLSHFTLEVCAPIVDHSPKKGQSNVKDVEITHNPATGIGSIKWEFDDRFRDGTFSFTLDGDYAMGAVRVTAKAGAGATIGTIIGPICTAQGLTEVRNEKHCHGRLEITKVVDWSGATPDTDQDFEICIQGPSFPTGTEDGACQTTGYNGDTLAWENLEAGDYTITETAPSGFWAAPTIDPAGGVVNVVVDQTATATVTNTYLPGSLEVTKVVDWSGVTPQTGQSFQICIAGPSYPGGNCKTFGYNGETLTWDNLRPGTYTVTETDPGASWTVSGSGVGIDVPSGGTGSHTVTNTFIPGSLLVTKVVDWNGVAPVDGQSFTICIKGPSYQTGSEPGACQVVSAPDWKATWSALLPGEYIVTETDAGDEWTVSVTGSPAAVVSGSQATATVTNTRKLGSLEITKVVNWGDETADDSKEFTICITGPSFPSGDCKIAGFNGAVLSWTGLIPGVYQIAEQDPGSDWDVVISSSEVTVPSNGGKACATVTNTLLRGALTITKVADWNGITPDTSQTFTICVTPVSGGTPDCKTIGYEGGALTWDLLPPGDYIVIEQALGSEWEVSIVPEQVTVVEGQPAAGTVTNTRKLGGLDVTKVVSWNGITAIPGTTFEICIQGPSFPLGTEAGACQTVSEPDWLASWSDLIPGSYSITEPNLGEEWLTDVPQSAVVPIDGSTATATVTNTFDPGSLTVQKVVNWGDISPQTVQTFTICIQGPSFSLGTEPGACQSVGYQGGPVTWTNLIPGDYTVTEANPGPEWQVWGSGVTAKVWSGVMAIEMGQKGVNIENIFLTGDLLVEKVVDWKQVPVDENQQFEICITGPSYPAGDCQTVDFDGGPVYWDNLIPGLYAISETDPGSLWDVTIEPSSVQVEPRGAPVMTIVERQPDSVVTNTHLLGALTVEKEVQWNRVPEQADRTFEICVEGPSFQEPQCRQFKDGDSYTWTDLIPGAYIVTETPWTGDPLTWTVEVVYEPAGAEYATVVAGGEAYVKVLNVTDQESPPTAVQLVSWTAVGGAGTVTHTWETAFEKDTLAFRIYRGADLATAELVGEVAAQGRAAGYQLVDQGLASGNYSYWLVEVEADGSQGQVYGAKVVTVGAAGQWSGHTVYLPLTLKP